jgi:Zn-finger nucleic acid-binding protein
MRRCPGCLQPMNVLTACGLELEACPTCGGFWFDLGELETAVPAEAVRRMTSSALGRPGLCKVCGAANERIGPCPRCERPAPACPACGELLRAGVHRGVAVDVCEGCLGIFLDAGELQQLAARPEVAAEIQRAAVTRPHASGPAVRASDLRCVGCQRRLRARHAFTSGSESYCGSCAPAGASPMVAELTRRDPEVYGYLEEPEWYGPGEGGLGGVLSRFLYWMTSSR